MKVAVRVIALLFARLREQAGGDRFDLELPAGATVADAYAELRRRHPALEARREIVRPAVNQEFAAWDDTLAEGDEVAFIPPVSGGAARTLYKVVETPLDVREVIRAVEDPGAGAIVSFTGTVRDNSLGKEVTGLTYEAYPAAAEKMLARVGEEVLGRWPALGVAIIHRTGQLVVGEASVVIAVSAPRRHAAFEACEHVIVRLKEIVPIWKKEHTDDGAIWIDEHA